MLWNVYIRKNCLKEKMVPLNKIFSEKEVKKIIYERIQKILWKEIISKYTKVNENVFTVKKAIVI